MPTFSRHVPNDPRGPAFPIVRCSPNKPLIGIITSQDLVGCYTHFFKGRTVPCDAPDCEACRENLPYRWHAYQSAYDPLTGLHYLLEVTAQAAEKFCEYRDDHHGLRGCMFEAKRMHGRHNGRVLIRTKPADLTSLRLPKPPDLIKCLSILWDFPTDDVIAGKINPEKKTRTAKHQPKGPTTP